MEKFISEKCYSDIVEMAARIIAENFIELNEMKKAKAEYDRKGFFDNETDKKHIDKVYNAGFTLKDTGRGTKNVIEWERK